MSFDGEQRIVIVRSSDEDTVARRVRPVLKWKEGRSASRIVTLQYIFGFGETHPIGFRELDNVVKLPWRRESGGSAALEIRVLPAATLPNVSKILDGLRKTPRALSRSIAAATHDDTRDHQNAYDILKSNPKELDLDDADSDAGRLAQWLMQLRRSAKRAAKVGEAIAVGVRISGF